MDIFSEYPTSLTAPARNGAPITPDDHADFAQVTRAIYVGQTGSVVVRLPEGGVVTFANAQAGSLLPVRIRGVNATGTSAAGLVALW